MAGRACGREIAGAGGMQERIASEWWGDASSGSWSWGLIVWSV